MNVGNIRNDMVCFTRSRLVVILLSARIHRATICTEYSTAKPTESTKDMLEKPVKLTSASALNPITVISDVRIVAVISNAPTRLPQKILRFSWRPSKLSFPNKKAHEMPNPTADADRLSSIKTAKMPSYWDQ
jgi:hypothetical protein